MNNVVDSSGMQCALIAGLRTESGPERLVIAYPNERSLREFIAAASIIAVGFSSREEAGRAIPTAAASEKRMPPAVAENTERYQQGFQWAERRAGNSFGPEAERQSFSWPLTEASLPRPPLFSFLQMPSLRSSEWRSAVPSEFFGPGHQHTRSRGFLESRCGGRGESPCLRGGLMARSLLQQDLGHHPFVLVIQQMAMKYRHTLNDRVGEIQDDVHVPGIRNIHGVQPRWIGE